MVLLWGRIRWRWRRRRWYVRVLCLLIVSIIIITAPENIYFYSTSLLLSSPLSHHPPLPTHAQPHIKKTSKNHNADPTPASLFRAKQVRAAEDILTLSRVLKETWLFGKLHTVGTSEAEERAEAAAGGVAVGLAELSRGEEGEEEEGGDENAAR